MSDNNKPTQPAEIGGKAIPMGMKYHWWYDSKAAGVGNTPPSNLTGYSPPNNYSVLSQSPPGVNMNNANPERRGSLKNMVHLCDFATP